MHLLYEVDSPAIEPDAGVLDTAALWRFHSRVTLEHLELKLSDNAVPGGGQGAAQDKDDLAVLRHFLAKASIYCGS